VLVATALPAPSLTLVSDRIEPQLNQTQPVVVEVPEVAVQPVVEEADAFGVAVEINICVDRGQFLSSCS
jgi:hypothetical protein